MSYSIDLSSQVVLVTGGTQGIGHAIVEKMLCAGARVAFCAPDQLECDQVVAAFNREFEFGEERVIGLAGDLRDRESLTSFVNSVLARWGKIDTLVCNATVFGVQCEIEDASCEGFAHLLESNLVNNFHLCRLVLPQMQALGAGSIIFITSISGFSAMPTNIPYSSSKAALTSMARSLAAKYADQGIRVNCISPGLIRTEGSRSAWENEEAASSFVREKIPMQRIGQPSEIADACVFIASPQASYITAATLPVDGGRVGVGQSSGSTAQIQKPKTS
ncbi:MAG: hypothetical protein RL300_929 [Pseudomonadota bacterium]|jgi:NAD(P)-dependent dehydrogenase (short-subunit alcohol dehydrogenase family)